MHGSSQVVQALRQRNADSGRHSLQCHVAQVAQGLAFEHQPYNAVIDTVRG